MTGDLTSINLSVGSETDSSNNAEPSDNGFPEIPLPDEGDALRFDPAADVQPEADTDSTGSFFDEADALFLDGD